MEGNMKPSRTSAVTSHGFEQTEGHAEVVRRPAIHHVRVAKFDGNNRMQLTKRDPDFEELGGTDSDGEQQRTFLYVVDEDGVIEILAHRYAPYQVTTKSRTVRKPMLMNGKLVSRYDAQTISSYIDLLTGEVIKSTAMTKRQVGVSLRLGECVLQKRAVIKKLRPEVRGFALFVLKFRDHRRGVTPSMRTLAKWYASLHGRRTSDVMRYIGRLEAAGICAGECMTPLFQIASSRMQRSHYLGEHEVAGFRYAALQRDRDEAIRRANPWQVDGMPYPPSDIDPLRKLPDGERWEDARPPSAQFGSQVLRSGVVVPLQHLQRSVPSDGSQFDDVREAIGEPRGCGVPKVVEAQILQFSTPAESFEHLVQCSNADWKDGLAA